MSLAARRAVTLLVALAATLAACILVLVEPAMAATTTSEATGFGASDADGALLVVIAGVLVGVLGFLTSDPGGIPRADAHHDHH